MTTLPVMPDSPDDKRPHRLEDHLLGVDPDHVHEEGGADHDHDHDHDDDSSYDLAASSLFLQDNLSLLSVGIDIGSAGTQTVFSNVQLRRMGEELTSRYVVAHRETVYQSPVALTPYIDDTRIDDEAIGRLVDAAYAAAGVHPDDVDAGSVLLTGEALRRDNARAIADVLADIAGEFVCAAAGHHMEAMLAAYGSGAAEVSHDGHARILNIDIGGGTTKLALIDRGQVLRTAALHLGGRLIVVDASGRITRMDPAGQAIAARAGFTWALGSSVTDANLDAVASWMADALVTALVAEPTPSDIDSLWLTEPLGIVEAETVAGAMCSGGVAEFIYDREGRDFSDLGRRFGHAVRQRFEQGRFPFVLLPAGECIRATALGASEFSVQLSGNTVYISSPRDLLPRRNLPVVHPRLRLDETIDASAVSAAIADHLRRFDLVEGDVEIALAFRWHGPPTHARVAALAGGIVAAMPRTIAARKPLFVILDGDIAHTLGALIKEELGVGSELLVLDGVALWDFDYVDLGRVRLPSFTVPITIKSLIFSADPRIRPHTHRHHGHGHHHHPDHREH